MNEDELKTLGYEEAEAAILPSGWTENDDIFADESSWEGAEQSDETEETPAEETTTGTEPESEEVPTTDESAEADGQSADVPEETNPGKTPRILPLKVNHKDQEVDVNAMTDEELIERFQKSYAFDAMKDDQMKEKYRQVYEEQIEFGMSEAAAKMVAANECGGKNYSLEDDATDTDVGTTETRDEVTPSAPARDISAEARQLKALYPDFTELPNEVAREVAAGKDLLSSYSLYRTRAAEKTATQLRKELAIEKQNSAAAARAPVTGTVGGGTTDTKADDPFMVGFKNDHW